MDNNRRAGTWSVSGAVARGDPAYKGDKPCQDAVSFLKTEDMVVAALADGAGSASLSHIGAAVVVRTACNFLRTNFGRFLGEEREDAQREIIQTIQAELGRLAEEHHCQPRDLTSTLLFVAIQHEKYVAGSLGDGVLGFRVAGASCAMYKPQKGEFANETIFVTHSDAGNRLQTTVGRSPPISGFVMMSDGSAESLYHRGKHKLARGVGVLWSWHEDHDEATVSEAIQTNLNEVLRSKTHDDCSLVVLTLVGFEQRGPLIVASPQNEPAEETHRSSSEQQVDVEAASDSGPDGAASPSPLESEPMAESPITVGEAIEAGEGPRAVPPDHTDTDGTGSSASLALPDSERCAVTRQRITAYAAAASLGAEDMAVESRSISDRPRESATELSRLPSDENGVRAEPSPGRTVPDPRAPAQGPKSMDGKHAGARAKGRKERPSKSRR